MNPRIAGIPPSLIRSINARKRPGDIDLGLGEPTLRPDDAPFVAALEWTRQNGLPYTPNAGDPELRAALAGYLAPHWLGEGPAAEQICVTVGSEEALFLAIKTAVNPDRDEVLIVEPCYLAYPKICMLEGVRHRMVALEPARGFAPDAEAVLAALRPETRLVVLNTPGNPTGRVWPASELRRLAEGLAERPGPPTYVLADEVYRELYFGAEPPPSIAEFHPHTLVAGSVSKSNALTGLRLGWLAGPAEVIAAAIKVHQFVNTAASTFSQRVALALLANPGSLGAHRPHYAEVRKRLLASAEAAGVSLLPPEGGFYAYLRLPPPFTHDSLTFAERLLDAERVVAVPGRAFGESGEGWLRISWVVSPELVEEGVQRIGAFFRKANA